MQIVILRRERERGRKKERVTKQLSVVIVYMCSVRIFKQVKEAEARAFDNEADSSNSKRRRKKCFKLINRFRLNDDNVIHFE